MAKYKADANKKAVKRKISQVSEITEDIKHYSTVALLDLRKLPDSLLQQLRKKIREENGKIRILKKPVLQRVVKIMPQLAEKVGECNKPMALLTTNWSSYQLNRFFRENKKKRAAKIGDVAPFEIIVPEGETELPPGPALSELKTAGLNVMIKAGKIVVAKDSTVAKHGETITAQKANALQKLNIMPFEVMATLVYSFDGKHVYSKELLDIDLTLNNGLVASYMDAFNLSLNAGIPTQENTPILLGKAIREAVNIGVNGHLYSSSSIEQLLTLAVRHGMALESLKTEKK